MKVGSEAVAADAPQGAERARRNAPADPNTSMLN